MQDDGSQAEAGESRSFRTAGSEAVPTAGTALQFREPMFAVLEHAAAHGVVTVRVSNAGCLGLSQDTRIFAAPHFSDLYRAASGSQHSM